MTHYWNTYFKFASKLEIIISSNVQSPLKYYKIYGDWYIVLKLNHPEITDLNILLTTDPQVVLKIPINNLIWNVKPIYFLPIPAAATEGHLYVYMHAEFARLNFQYYLQLLKSIQCNLISVCSNAWQVHFLFILDYQIFFLLCLNVS